ncbi:MAG: ABC transporter ATP-binding protein [Rubrivivax sp.]|nr:ABC transporter ATP-binding protein [Rubrivivax sp.]
MLSMQIKRPLGAVFISAAVLVAAGGAQAQDTSGTPAGPSLVGSAWSRVTSADAWQQPGIWRLNVAPFSHHFRYSEEHRYVWAVGAERQSADDWLAGASFFRNSFGQPSAYAYIGRRFPGLLGQPQLFGQVSAGVLYGYVGKYKNKVPLNVGGFSPGALVSLGWQFDARTSASVHLLGDAGFMVQLSWDWR